MSGMRGAVLAMLLTSAAWGQLATSVVDSGGERPPTAVVDLGGVSPEEASTARFVVRNTSDTPSLLSVLSLRGTGFSLSGAPIVPAAVAARQTLEFRVDFQASGVGNYSAELVVNGVSTLLIASVLPRVTYPTGVPDFGAVEVGAAVTSRVTVRDLTGMLLPPPVVSISGEAFALGDAGSMQYDIMFRPPGAGPWTGSLTIDGRTYPLHGTAMAIPLPKPSLTVDIVEARSGQQGSVSVTFDAPARAAGAGVLSLDFDGPADSAIQLGVVGRSLPFAIAAGDTRARFGELDAVAFTTGTTAGTIGITVELGGATDRKTVTIPAAPVTILSAAASRSTGMIEVRVSGIDNTRTAGAATFTFFDATGAPLPAIPIDARADFAAYFAGSDAGGMFLLRSVFPVSGDASKVVEFAVQMTNAAGSSTTGRVKF